MTNENEQAPIVINSDRLRVEIAAPNTVYKGTRFDWTGFITQVTLDGLHTFCVPEDYRPGKGTGGIGLCNEFGIQTPIGYADAKVGDLFPKLGIGLLRRPDQEDYNYFRTYEIAKAFPLAIEQSVDHVRFDVLPLDCRGYAVRYVKTLSVKSNRLNIEYRLENTGNQFIVTNEYCHNFIGIDQQKMGPDYRMRFPFLLNYGDLEKDVHRSLSIITVEGQDIRLKETPVEQFYCRPSGVRVSSHYQWELTYLPTQVGMREMTDFVPLVTALWGDTHVISAEVFIVLNLPPGDSKTWTRSYEFFS